MTTKNQKPELTRIGKEKWKHLEPHTLLEDPGKSYYASHRVTDHDILNNRLICGDNLLALKALQRRRNCKSRALSHAQNEIARRCERLISEIERKFQQQADLRMLFSIHWRLV